MAIELPLPQIATQQAASLEERIKGTATHRVLTEFFGTSALFPILDAIRVISEAGILAYLAEPSHYALFAAAFFQAWFLGTAHKDNWQTRFVGNLLGFALYLPLDLSIEGFNFFAEPYHWLFGAFSLTMAVLSALQAVRREHVVWQTVVTLLSNVGKAALFPMMYYITEQQIEVFNQLTWASWQEYMASSGHRFIFYGALFFGALLGLAEAQRNQYAGYLRFLAEHLKRYSEWSLSADLIAESLNNPNSLALRRVEKTILFMDIRGFTAWSERVDPQLVVDMLTRYYDASESIIARYQGQKPNFTADEIMTRFGSPEAALQAAQQLQHTLEPMLGEVNLSVGVGLNTGEIIEGLMGSSGTRKYDIIGDAVNTAKRLESAAGPGEIVISQQTYLALKHLSLPVSGRTIKAKGKREPLQIYVINR
ncbi:MAG: adenylate/guanylate cyclase domain-containing protein [Anaerolineae bacterium]